MIKLVLIFLLASCTKYIPVYENKLFCSELNKIEITDEQRKFLIQNNLKSFSKAVEENEAARFAWCEYEH